MTVKTAVRHDAILGGLGGKGVLTIGQLIAEVGLKRFQHVLYLPAHGLFMRGGLAECSVIISEEKIASLLLSQAEAVLVLEPTVLKQFEQRVQPGGILIVETAGLKDKVERKDIKVLPVPGMEIAAAVGDGRTANFVHFGVYLAATNALPLDLVEQEMEVRFGERASMVKLNREALRQGVAYAKDKLGVKAAG